jgi:hypothetical protein
MLKVLLAARPLTVPPSVTPFRASVWLMTLSPPTVPPMVTVGSVSATRKVWVASVD